MWCKVTDGLITNLKEKLPKIENGVNLYSLDTARLAKAGWYEVVTPRPPELGDAFKTATLTHNLVDGVPVATWIVSNKDLTVVKNFMKSGVSAYSAQDSIREIIFNNHVVHCNTVTLNLVARKSAAFTMTNKDALPPVMFYFDDGTSEELDNDALKKLQYLLEKRDQEIADNREAHCAAIDALDTHDAVLKYDYTTEW